MNLLRVTPALRALAVSAPAVLAGCGDPAPAPQPAAPPSPPIAREDVATIDGVGRITDLVLDGPALVAAGRDGMVRVDPGTGTPGQVTPWPAPALGDARFVDLDGDADREVLVAGRGQTALFLVDPDEATVITIPIGTPIEQALPIDVDGDGDMEIAVVAEGTDSAFLFDHTGALVWERRWSADVSSMMPLPGQVPHIAYVDGMSLVTRDSTGEVVTRVRPTQGGVTAGLLVATDLPGFPGPTLVVPHEIPGEGLRYDLFAPDGESPRGQLPKDRIEPYLAGGTFTGPGGRTHVHTDLDAHGTLHVRFYDDARISLWSDHLEGQPGTAHALLVTDDAAWVGWGPRLLRYTRPAR